jgi:hypothetical protein
MLRECFNTCRAKPFAVERDKLGSSSYRARVAETESKFCIPNLAGLQNSKLQPVGLRLHAIFPL